MSMAPIIARQTAAANARTQRGWIVQQQVLATRGLHVTGRMRFERLEEQMRQTMVLDMTEMWRQAGHVAPDPTAYDYWESD